VPELLQQTYDATDVERQTVERLLTGSRGRGRSGSVTRTLPSNSGPLRVEAGDQAWIVHDDGSAVEIDPFSVDSNGDPIELGQA
jgi:hypothetical protein